MTTTDRTTKHKGTTVYPSNQAKAADVRERLEQDPEALQWMADTLAANGWIVAPPTMPNCPHARTNVINLQRVCFDCGIDL